MRQAGWLFDWQQKYFKKSFPKINLSEIILTKGDRLTAWGVAILPFRNPAVV